MQQKNSPQKRDFRHESLQDASALERYLEALAQGFRSRSLQFKDNEGEITLEPSGLIQLDLGVSRKRDRHSLTLKFSWKAPAEDEADPGPLLINGNHD